MKPRCLVSVDLEEWSDARLAGVPREARDRLPRTLEGSVERLLALLEHRRARATFFVLGRVARRYPALVRMIAERHEIASHGDSHEDLPRLGPDGFARELEASVAILEDLAGRKVLGFRAPNWSMGSCMEWGLPVLEARGIAYDSSLLPGRGFLFLRGRPGSLHGPHKLGALWEFPPTVVTGPGFSIPAAGGAFLRTLPSFAVARILRRAAASGEIPHIYLHPWEFDPPALPGVGRARRALLFAGARSLPVKLSRILAEHRAIAIEDLWREMSGAKASCVARAVGASA